jgi:hypothetical protein
MSTADWQTMKEAQDARRLLGLGERPGPVAPHLAGKSDAELKQMASVLKSNPKIAQIDGALQQWYKGMVDFAVQCGAISKEDAAAMSKAGDYTPWYRHSDDGTVLWDMPHGRPMRIGNTRYQADLQHLMASEKGIVDFLPATLHNAQKLMSLAMKNYAAKEAANSLAEMGMGRFIDVGRGNKGSDHNTIYFKKDGADKAFMIDPTIDYKDAAKKRADNLTGPGDFSADMLARGLDGTIVAMPKLVQWMGMPTTLFRNMVLRLPSYSVRAMVREGFNTAFTLGSNTVPVIGGMNAVRKFYATPESALRTLQRSGVMGGNMITGDNRDMTKLLNSLAAGRSSLGRAMDHLDQFHTVADNAQKAAHYQSMIDKGISPLEAQYSIMQAENMATHGAAGSMAILRRLVPFMGATINGIDASVSGLMGRMPLNERQQIKKKLIARSLMFAAASLAYGITQANSQDEEGERYRNATPEDRMGHMFVGGFKVPVEANTITGLIHMLAQATVGGLLTDDRARDIMPAMASQVAGMLPGIMPQAIKPLAEVATNHSFLTGRQIETDSMQGKAATERYTADTPDVYKAGAFDTTVGGMHVSLSPVQIKALTTGYFSTFSNEVAKLLDMSLEGLDMHAGAVRPTRRPEQVPFFGSMVQPQYGNNYPDKMSEDAEYSKQRKASFQDYVNKGDSVGAQQFMADNMQSLRADSVLAPIQKQIQDLRKMANQIRFSPQIKDPDAKRQMLDQLKRREIELSKRVVGANLPVYAP